MKIDDYVTEVCAENKHLSSFPTEIDIPKVLVDYCWSLYTTGEQRGIELGVNLNIDSGSMSIGKTVFEGTPSGINIVNSENNSNFGDLHCHPSNSIGHVSGFAAHSPEDFLAIRSNENKPLFLRFVASGTKIYLVVYRSGLSIIDNNSILKVRQNSTDTAQKFFDDKCLVSRDMRNDAMGQMGSNQEIAQYITQRRRETPGLGKEMERLSIQGARNIAQRGHFGFYSGDQGLGISVWWYDYLRLRLVV